MVANPTVGQRIGAAHAELVIQWHPNVGREEYLDYMTFKANERPLFTEIFGPLLGLKEEWAAQGATAQELDFSAFRYRDARDGWLPVTTGWLGGREEEILQETSDLLIYRDRLGRTMQLAKGAATLAIPCDYPVATMDDWLAIKSHYEFSEERVARDWKAAAMAHRDAGRIVSVDIPGGFDEPRQLMGEEALAMACYDERSDAATTSGNWALLHARCQIAHPFDHVLYSSLVQAC